MSKILVAAVLAFVAVASGVLLWEGLAVGLVHGPVESRRALRGARARLVVGAIGLAIVIWIVSGVLTHAW